MPTPELRETPHSGLNGGGASNGTQDSHTRSAHHRPQLATGIVVSVEGRIHRAGLVALLSTQPDFRVLGETDSSAETVRLCATHRPHVLVLGSQPTAPRDQSPISAVRLASPTTHVLALASHGADRCAHLNPPVPTTPGRSQPTWATHSTCLQDALSRGALAAVEGDAEPATLFAALRAVAVGERWGNGSHPVTNGKGHLLSPQELKVARLVGEGASNKEIAAALAISDLTVKKHVGSILQKLGLNDRLQLGVSVARNPLAFEFQGARD
jgi:DNA-binding NarL/FixJ family response regulator